MTNPFATAKRGCRAGSRGDGVNGPVQARFESGSVNNSLVTNATFRGLYAGHAHHFAECQPLLLLRRTYP
jgi:hypothetical protein